jgi:hypothetical protein
MARRGYKRTISGSAGPPPSYESRCRIGRNAAAALATEKFRPTHLLFVGNDMIVDPNFIGALVAPSN